MIFLSPAEIAGISMQTFKSLTPSALWRYVPQLFIGLFFLSAAFLKEYEALFGPNRYSLGQILQVWIDQQWGLGWYMNFLAWMNPYADVLAVLVIIGQAVAGLSLVLNYRTRIAGVLIFFIQLNVYLAVYHQIELRNLNAEALWIGLFFFARPEMRGRLWTLMTYALALFLLSHLYGRMTMFGDPWTSSFAWQFEEFTFTSMSSWLGLKNFVVWFYSGKYAAVLWAASWWIKLALALGLLTRYRLYAGAALLVYMFGVTLVWMNTFTCEGVFWVLILYVWLTHEREIQQVSEKPPMSLLP